MLPAKFRNDAKKKDIPFRRSSGVIKSESKQRCRRAAWWNATSGRVSGRMVSLVVGRLAFSPSEACKERPLHRVLSDAVPDSL